MNDILLEFSEILQWGMCVSCVTNRLTNAASLHVFEYKMKVTDAHDTVPAQFTGRHVHFPTSVVGSYLMDIYAGDPSHHIVKRFMYFFQK